MTRAPARGLPPVLVVLLGALTSVVAGVMALSRHAEVLVHQCVADGTAGAIGLRLAFLRHDAACPSGELAVGGDTRQVVGVVVLVALPVVVAHLLGAVAGVSLVARVRSALRTVRDVLAGLVRPRTAVRVPVVRARWTPFEVTHARLDDPWLAVPTLRGPPVVPA
ncbi:hypothetical protein OEB99_12150 [Actinotalea sp. M2MS4P-6]|uniref:wax ester/triacylglycerol synthase domain-containing protein n=1 Tax=Actinotalea sp. M2MS4P-6 TaxID=2983762 RepID=UPI0021E4184C|nr:wax ester/triacylglycerol synthase domain-containing protein [Actinotalea sp. M2MS4P-6]MCV2395062.1 hypothetical protein [Actinotalea sp. M2MS4P-6]